MGKNDENSIENNNAQVLDEQNTETSVQTTVTSETPVEKLDNEPPTGGGKVSEEKDSRDSKDSKLILGLKNDDNNTGKNTENDDNKKKKKIIAVIIAIIAIIIIILLGLTQCNGNIDPWYDSNAKNGSYEGKTQEQIIADLNAQVKEGMMNISCAATMQGKAGNPNVTARFENIEANHWDQKIKLYLGDPNNGGELLYESGALAPGQSIDTIQLNRTFDNGSYDVTAVFTGYDRDSHEERANRKLNVAQFALMN